MSTTLVMPWCTAVSEVSRGSGAQDAGVRVLQAPAACRRRQDQVRGAPPGGPPPHGPVRAALTLPTMQDWHMIMVPEEVEVAVTRALEEAGLGRSARRMMEEARRGQEHHTVTAKVEVQDSLKEVVVVKEVQRKPKQGW